MFAARRLVFTAPVLVMLLWAGFAAANAFVAENALADALKVFRSWTGTALPPQAEWKAAWDGLESAHQTAPSNPVILELMGLLASRRADDPALVRQAPAFLERSLALRPASPRTWANLAEARYLSGDTSPAFESAMVTAMRIGPSEPHAQRVVADYGLAVWGGVGAGTRAAIEGAVAAGVRRKPLEMLQIAERRGRLSVACRYVSGVPRQPDANVLRLCPSRETAR